MRKMIGLGISVLLVLIALTGCESGPQGHLDTGKAPTYNSVFSDNTLSISIKPNASDANWSLDFGVINFIRDFSYEIEDSISGFLSFNDKAGFGIVAYELENSGKIYSNNKILIPYNMEYGQDKTLTLFAEDHSVLTVALMEATPFLSGNGYAHDPYLIRSLSDLSLLSSEELDGMTVYFSYFPDEYYEDNVVRLSGEDVEYTYEEDGIKGIKLGNENYENTTRIIIQVNGNVLYTDESAYIAVGENTLVSIINNATSYDNEKARIETLNAGADGAKAIIVKNGASLTIEDALFTNEPAYKVAPPKDGMFAPSDEEITYSLPSPEEYKNWYFRVEDGTLRIRNCHFATEDGVIKTENDVVLN